jgi:hypothetical protein
VPAMVKTLSSSPHPACHFEYLYKHAPYPAHQCNTGVSSVMTRVHKTNNFAKTHQSKVVANCIKILVITNLVPKIVFQPSHGCCLTASKLHYSQRILNGHTAYQDQDLRLQLNKTLLNSQTFYNPRRTKLQRQ